MIKSKSVLTPHRHDTIGAMPLGHYHARAGSSFDHRKVGHEYIQQSVA